LKNLRDKNNKKKERELKPLEKLLMKNPKKEKNKELKINLGNDNSRSVTSSDSSNESLIKFLTRVYKGDKTESKNFKKELKSIRKNYKENLSNIGLENETQKKNELINEYRSTNFFNKFKVFDKKNPSMDINSRYNLNKTNQNKYEKNSEFNNVNNENNLKNNFSTFRTQIILDKDKDKDKKLTKKELLDKKQNDNYIRSINYKDIIKENISIMKTMFPLKNIENNTISVKDNKNKFKTVLKNVEKENKQIDFNNETNISFKNMQDNQVYNTTFESNFEDNTIYRTKGKKYSLII
jgi:hypothetical protein